MTKKKFRPGIPGSGIINIPVPPRKPKPEKMPPPAEYHDPERASSEESVRRHRGRYERAITLLGRRLPPGAIVDCACGTGYGTALLAAAYGSRDVVGVDRSPGAIDVARRRYGGAVNVTFYQLDVRQAGAWMPGLGEVAAVVTIETIEHLQEGVQQRWLLRAMQGIVPGGKIVVMCPTKKPGAAHGGPSKRNPWHVYEPTTYELGVILAEAAGMAWGGKADPVAVMKAMAVEEYTSTAGETAWQTTVCLTRAE